MMMRKEQHGDTLTEVRRKKRPAQASLSAKRKLSEYTIRPDVNLPSAPDELLEANEDVISLPSRDTNPAYTEIARKTISLITDGMLLFVAGGPIMQLLAMWLPIEIAVTVYTFDLLTALNFNKHENIRVVVLGGQLSGRGEHLVLAYQPQALLDIRPNLYLIEAEALSVGKGLTAKDWEIAQVIKAIINSAHQTVALCVSSNLNMAQAMHVCTPNRLSGMVTELEPQHPLLEKFTRSGLKIY